MYLTRIGTDLPYLSHESYPHHYYDLVAEQKGEDILLRGDLPKGIMAEVSARMHGLDGFDGLIQVNLNDRYDSSPFWKFMMVVL